jgi:hypothetical protein
VARTARVSLRADAHVARIGVAISGASLSRMFLTVHGSKWESPQPMRLQRSEPRPAGRVFVLALGAAAFSACIPTAAQSPDAAPLEPLPCYGSQCIPPTQNLGAPVTTAPLVHCDDNMKHAPVDGYEFFPVDILNNNGGTATYFYQYVDGTAGIWPSGYGPPAIQQNICDTDTNNYVLHESGGPFYGWGGGIGIGLAHINTDVGLCLSSGAACQAPGGYAHPDTPCTCPPPVPGQLGVATSAAALDVSQWEGISFWARRGPAGQPLMRVLVGDKFTDDDISYLMYVGNPNEPRLCERKGECTCMFQDTTCDWYSATDPTYGPLIASVSPPATPDPFLPPALQNGAYFCGAPGSHPGPASSGITTANLCGRSLCDYAYPAYPNNGPDPAWAGRACTPFTYRNGTQADVCYNPTATVNPSTCAPVPADPLPAESDEQCGDHFTFPVELSENWQFYTIPFAQMSQQGWAKQAPYFDLTTASVVRFTWDTGFVDYYIDDVRFYRLKANGPSTTPPP